MNVTMLYLSCQGYIAVQVDSGAGFRPESNQNKLYAKGAIVLEKCYTEIHAVRVQGPHINAWSGSVSFSSDGGVTYTAGQCGTCTNGTGTAQLSVDANNDSAVTAAAACLSSKTCSIQVPDPGVCKLLYHPGRTPSYIHRDAFEKMQSYVSACTILHHRR